MKNILSKYSPIGTVYFLISMLILLGIWQLVTFITKSEIPGPLQTWIVFSEMLAEPFYDYGPNDKGIGLQLWYSLRRVFVGFAIGSLIAIPAGLIMGSSKIGMKLLNPIVQILRPVSPLAWFPLGLLAFKASDQATIFIITITSLWPTLINNWTSLVYRYCLGSNRCWRNAFGWCWNWLFCVGFLEWFKSRKNPFSHFDNRSCRVIV
jgi:nitrate/nitrite transport system permease protein